MVKANPIVSDVQRWLTDADLASARLLASRYDPDTFGDGEAAYRLGRLTLRFVRDRGQYFLDIGTDDTADRLYPFGDVEVALGGRPLDELVGLKQPEQIPDVLRRLRLRRDAIEGALTGPDRAELRARIEDVARQRGLAIYRKIRAGS
jgi:hypothetical protein